MGHDIVRRRLLAHGLAGVPFEEPSDVVRWFGAVQAQDYLGARWAIGLRTRDATEADVERALAARAIVRTWPMRGTLHFVPAEDARWMLRLLAPRVLAANAARERQLGLDAAAFARGRRLLVKALEGGRRLTRAAAYGVLEAGGIPTAGQRGIHVLWRLAQEGLVCHATREGKQQSFALLDEWVPPSSSRNLGREEALAELARRYFTGHGPALLGDFVWWSGLPAGEAREALALAAPALDEETIGGQTYWSSRHAPAERTRSRSVHLLPAFDEWLVGYRNRDAVLHPAHARRVHDLLSPTVVDRGEVVGTWRRALEKGAAVVTPTFFGRAGETAVRALAAAARRYGRFVGRPAVVAGLDERP